MPEAIQCPQIPQIPKILEKFPKKEPHHQPEATSTATTKNGQLAEKVEK
jgi:hypothetical protein